MATPVYAELRIYYLSENALTVHFGDVISDDTLQKVQSLNTALHDVPFEGLLTTVPAYTTLSIFYDALAVKANALLTGANGFDKVAGYVQQLAAKTATATVFKGNLVDIPVCYGGTYGPDLDMVATMNQLQTDEVIGLHVNTTYTVGMIGFLPGFAYLTGLDGRIATPRKASPRKLVHAGSVGIAGSQTGIYPLNSPGGWQIIGRTPLPMFNVLRQPATLLNAGDQVIFRPVSAQEFEDIAHSRYADHH